MITCENCKYWMREPTNIDYNESNWGECGNGKITLSIARLLSTNTTPGTEDDYPFLTTPSTFSCGHAKEGA